MATATNLFQYYQNLGQQLPSVQQRQTLAGQAGIQNYIGTAQQNQQLLGYLQNPTNSLNVQSGTPVLDTNVLTQNGTQPQLPSPNPQAPIVPATSALNNPIVLPDVTANSQVQGQTLSAAERRLLELSGKLKGQGTEQLRLEQQAGIPQKQQQINDLTLALTQSANRFQQAQENFRQGQVGTQELSTGKQAQVQRNAAISLSGQSAVINALQGNLTQAKSDVDHALALEFDPIKQDIETTKQFIDFNYQNFDRAQKKEADDLNRKLDAQNKAIDRQIQQRQFNATLAASLLKDGKISNSQFSNIFSGKSSISDTLKDTGVNIAPVGTDPLSTLTSFINSAGAKTDDKLKLTGSVIASVQKIAGLNPTGDFAGLGPIRAGPLTVGQTGQYNRSYLSQLEGTIENWMTGAAVSDDQALRIKRDLVPRQGNTDKQIRQKLNALANYMLDYASGNLATQGITYRPPQVNLFAVKVPGVSIATPDSFLNQIPLSNSAISNEQFFQ